MSKLGVLVTLKMSKLNFTLTRSVSQGLGILLTLTGVYFFVRLIIY